jgi:hypothetical protein
MIALLYDVHGNLPALDAVIADARAAGTTGWLIGGDVALFGAFPAETVDRLRSLDGARWLRGNGERWTAAPAEAPGEAPVPGAIAAARAQRRLSFLPAPADGDDELLEGVTEQRLVFGHTHLPFRRVHRAIELVDPGSVGMPLDGDRRAAYALLRPDGEIEHRRVAYPHAETLGALRERFEGEWVEVAAGRLERAAF